MTKEDELYEVTITNVPFKQAQGLYRFLVDLRNDEDFYGGKESTWSGLIEGKRINDAFRTINLRPMRQVHEELNKLRDKAAR